MHLGLKQNYAKIFFFWAFVMLAYPVQAVEEDLTPEISDEEGERLDEPEDVLSETSSEAPSEEASVSEIEQEPSPYTTPDEVEAGDDEVVSYLLPYRKRRLSWGSLVSIGLNGYSPSNYQPDFVLDNFDNQYGRAETPLVELTVSVKKNYSLLALTLDIGAGYYSNSGADESQFTLIPLRLGLGISLDTLFDEPYVVPYVSAGGYSVLYKETVGTQSVNGNTEVGLYYTGGVRFQLDWIDRDGDYASYDESGVENTFLYLEARTFLLPNNAVPDLGSSDDQPLNLGGGFSMEF